MHIDKVVKLVGGGSVINGATLSSFDEPNFLDLIFFLYVFQMMLVGLFYCGFVAEVRLCLVPFTSYIKLCLKHYHFVATCLTPSSFQNLRLQAYTFTKDPFVLKHFLLYHS